MAHSYPLLVYAGLFGVLVLLAMETVRVLRPFSKPTTAAWLTFMTLIWLALPREGRWLFSVWTPSTVLSGQVLVDMVPALWWLGAALGLSFSGVAWIETVESRPVLGLSGGILLGSLMTAWFAICSGSLLTTLATWAVFDLLWASAGLLTGGQGERVTFGLVLHGAATLVLWVAYLLLGRAGSSALWWLMWPTPAILTLLTLATALRIGLYPFHIAFPRRLVSLEPLNLVHFVAPILGVALLYRMLSLPGIARVPEWMGALGAISLIWGALVAWGRRGPSALLWSGHALLGGMVTTAIAAGTGDQLLLAAAVWFASFTLLHVARRRDPRAVYWSLPGWLGLLVLAGVPLSPVGALFQTGMPELPWVWRLVIVAGWAVALAVLLSEALRRASGRVRPPWPWLQVGLVVGLLLPFGGLVGSGAVRPLLTFSIPGLALWSVAVLLAVGLVWKGEGTRALLRRGEVAVELVDLQWLYRSLWRGLEHVLGLVRVTSEVVEGSGSLLWSLLFVLIILLIVGNR